MKKILFIFCVLLCCQPCFCADWVEIFEKTYIDKDTINYSGGNVTFWIKMLRKNPKELILNKPYWFIMYNDKINCNTRQFKALSTIVYDLKGKIITDVPGYAWLNIPPGTFVEGYYNLLCY